LLTRKPQQARNATHPRKRTRWSKAGGVVTPPAFRREALLASTCGAYLPAARLASPALGACGAKGR